MKSQHMSALATVEVIAPDGEAVRLADLWSEQPVVLSLLRHFG
ncbi:MAG: hypothetical protein O3A10_15940 [Chloroflexi bacterium]|nr:hypothetical protein [Chloroflexota bacterium]MDA1148255.1 hypothetical protein [Chloroflexota bacterium]